MKFETICTEVERSYYSLINDQRGGPATYIPELAKVNPDHFGISVETPSGERFSIGDASVSFTLQSASKPFIYGLALQNLGRSRLLEKVGVEPTGEAFNSIIELEKNSHRPFNPMINSGAIAISDLIEGENFQERVQKVIDHFSLLSNQQVEVDESIYHSERATAHRNRSITHLLRHFNVVSERYEESLDLYFKQCSLKMDTKGLAHMAAVLAEGGGRIYSKEVVGDILSLMFTCGMYDTAGKWAYRVGIPAKSGVSGVLFGVVPGKLGIAVYSPRIDSHGHSIRAVQVFEQLSERLELHLLRPRGGSL